MPGIIHPWPVGSPHPTLLFQGEHTGKTEPPASIWACCVGKTKPPHAALLIFSTQRSGCCYQHGNQAQVLLMLLDLQTCI